MRYYEEFGLTSNASPEKIKESYRTLVRLLHPDQHADPALKMAAERQMRRINQIYSVLSDPERRRRYDAECAEPERLPVIVPAPPPVRRVSPGGLIWGAAAVAVCGFVLWLAGRDASDPAREFAFAGDAVEQPAGSAEARSAAPVKRRVEPAARPVAAPAGTSNSSHAAGIETAPGIKTAATVPVIKTAPAAIPPPEKPALAAPREPAALPAAANPEPAPALRPEPETAPPVHFAGAWFYPRGRTLNKNPALYPPEYIEAMITEEHGALHGRYRARYQVADRAISPDVVFQFDGKLSGPIANLTWAGAGGSRGLIHLKLLSESAMEVQWSASELGNAMGLVSGTAVLRRRAD